MKPKICAHRGASYHYPENTLKAFQTAIRHRADSLEVDIRATRDGHLVACHDFNLSRLTGKHLKVSEITFEEYKQLLINGQEPPASLEEILDLARGKLDIVLDVKQRGLEQKFLGMLHDFNISEGAIVSSFDPRIIATVKRQRPKIKTALIAGPLSIMPLAVNICFYLRRVSEYIKADYMHLCYMNYLHPGYQTLHNWGFKISYWTVDRPKDIRNILPLKPEAIITNRPRLALKIIESANRSTR